MNRVSSKSDLNGLKNVLGNFSLESAKSTKKSFKNIKTLYILNDIYVYLICKTVDISLNYILYQSPLCNAILISLDECIICTAHIVSNKKHKQKINKY